MSTFNKIPLSLLLLLLSVVVIVCGRSEASEAEVKNAGNDENGEANGIQELVRKLMKQVANLTQNSQEQNSRIVAMSKTNDVQSSQITALTKTNDKP